MKSHVILMIGMFVATSVHARTIEDIINQKEVKTKNYHYLDSYLQAVVINMSFGEYSIVSIMDKAKLKNAQIVQIDVIYTDYPKGMDLQHLNRQRIRKALETRSDLVSNELINWKLIRQMECKSEAEAKLLFHGVVIYYRPEFSPKVEEEFYKSTLPETDTVKITNSDFKQFKDSTVVASLRRNKSWTNPTIVTDVTGSMSPYVSQVLLWYLYKWNERERTNIVLFNDGDHKSTLAKIIGETGGIYTQSTNKYEDFLALLRKANSGGYGGDIPENGVEAILKAQEEFPDSKEIIFIADNYANMRDFELIPKIKIPVRIILCGTHLFVNLQYLELARKTGGSVHSIEQDLVDLSKLAEGKTFQFNRQTFIIKDGKILPFKST
jgi:hypothetical protein